MPINNIGVGGVGIRNLAIPEIPSYLKQPNIFLPGSAPVVVDIGTPIVNMPGCVEAHESNKDNNFQINEDDPDAVRVFCDAQIPSFNPLNYDEENIRMLSACEVDPNLPACKPVKKPPPDPPAAPDAPTPEIPKTPKRQVEEKEVPCPGPNFPRLGDVAQNQIEKVVGYKLTPDGKICEILYEPIKLVEQYLPTPQTAAVASTVAIVAGGSVILAKPFADLMIRLIKPTIKTIGKKISILFGKKVKVLSLAERRDLQRDRTRALRELKKKLR